ncbi:MAG TPA: outer membrane beta-barrel protein [Terracidiphilus sp.]
MRQSFNPKYDAWRRCGVVAVAGLFAIACISARAEEGPPKATNAATTTPSVNPATSTGASTAATGASGAASSSATDATPVTVSLPQNNEAAIKELSDMKKQFAQLAQMEAEMMARIGKLESQLTPGANAGAASAEKTASALRAAEGGATGTTPVSQAVTAPVAAAAPAPVEISAERTTKSAPMTGDWTWLNGGGRTTDSPMATKYFTPEFRADANYILDYNHPVDDSIGGSTEMFRSDEVQLEQISIGGDIRIDNVRGRFLCMCGGLWSTTSPRNDASSNRGQWDLADAYRYVAEGWGGYHFDVNHGLNVDAGIFVSYIGLFSYYNFDNWAYQPSFVSSNTPWFFNGVRVQWWPTEKLKIEPWFVNGWQSVGRYNSKPGLGGQILWRPKPYLDFVFNDYGLGEDDAGFPGRSRIHADYSGQFKVYDKPANFLDKIAFTVTGDAGCEYGGGPASFATANGKLSPTGASPMMGTTDTYNGGVNCHNSKDGKPKQDFVGWMAYNRYWFKKDLYAVTVGGGQMNNAGRYLTLLPPINGATATTGTPYFTENAGDRAQMHDGGITFDYMPSQFITFRLEENYRYSDVPYWTGHGGITPPGGNNGSPAQYACISGAASGYGYGTPLSTVNLACGGSATSTSSIWWPDLRTNETATIMAIMVRF